MSGTDVHFRTIQHGATEGCVSMYWGDYWWAAILVIVGVYSVLVPLAVKLSLDGNNILGLLCYPVLFVFAVSFIAPWCGLDSQAKGASINMITNMVVTGLAILAAVLNSAGKSMLLKDGPLGKLMNTRLGKPSKGWFEYDWYWIGPLNEFITMTLMEWLCFLVIMTWISISVWARWLDLRNPDETTAFNVHAVGKSLQQATLRLLLLSLLSPNRNTIALYYFGIPFERAIKWHKIFGRLMLLFMTLHVVLMISTSSVKDYAVATNSDGSYSTNAYGIPIMREVRWDNQFTLYGGGNNLACGPIAFFFWNLLVLSSLPYFRRKMFDLFYWLHLNFFFLANLMTVFHARAQVIPWVAAAFVVFYIDFSIRVIAKLSKVEAVSAEVIGDNIVKLVLKPNNFPLKSFRMHAGSYVWLSCNLRKTAGTTVSSNATATAGTESYAAVAVNESQVADGDVAMTVLQPQEGQQPEKTTEDQLREIFPAQKLPGGPPSGIPSWAFFHPITIASYDSETHAITLLIKAFGEGNKEWSGQLLSAIKLVEAGKLSLNDIGFHVGGPNGSLMIKEPLETLSRVVMFSGGIGVTPFIAITEHLIKCNYQGHVDFIWSTRSKAEIAALRPLFEKCATFPNMKMGVYYTGKDNLDEEENNVAGKGFSLTRGRPDIGKSFDFQADASSPTAVMCCGPDALMIEIEGRVHEQQAAGKNILFHRETFEF